MNPSPNVCEYCSMELPSPRFVKRHEARCLVKLRRLGKPETAWQQWVRTVRGDIAKQVRHE